MPYQISTEIPTMASVVDANDTEPLPLVVPHPPTVLYIPSFLDALVQRYIAEGLDNSWFDFQDTLLLSCCLPD